MEPTREELRDIEWAAAMARDDVAYDLEAGRLALYDAGFRAGYAARLDEEEDRV